jgi:hypothetical protein
VPEIAARSKQGKIFCLLKEGNINCDDILQGVLLVFYFMVTKLLKEKNTN